MNKLSKVFCTALLSGVIAISLTACNKNSSNTTMETKPSSESQGENVAVDNSIVIGIPHDLDSLDPHYSKSAGTREVLFNIFEGLLKPASNGELFCAVAGEYRVEDDGLKYIFTLRDGVKFHDGTDVTTEDVIFSLKRCAGLNGDEPIVPAFSYVESIDEKDGKVEVTLNQKHPEILYAFTVAIIPKKAVNDEDVLADAIGTGPFKFENREVQNYLELKKNDDYYGEKAHLDNVKFKVIADSSMIANELKSGSIQMFCRVNDAQAKEAANVCNILEGNMNIVQALYLNNAKEPLNNEKIRQALCYAVDRQKILDLLFSGKGHIIGSSMVPSFEKYYMPELENAYEYNVEKAKELLKEAGYENGFELEITVPSNYQQHVDTAQVIVEQLKEIGVKCKITPVDWATWLSETYKNRKFQSTVIGVDASTLSAEAFLSRFNSDAPNNFINFSDEEYDAKYNEAQEYESLDEQAVIYQECEKILSDRAASVYLQDMVNLVALNKDYEGYEYYPLYIIDAAKIKKVNK